MASARAGGFFYGWVIVGVTFSTQFLMTGCVYYSLSVMLTSLAAEFTGGDRMPIMVVPVVAAHSPHRLTGVECRVPPLV